MFFEIGKAGISFYIGKQGLESTYGAAASIVAVLIWVYYVAVHLDGRRSYSQLCQAEWLFNGSMRPVFPNASLPPLLVN
jgi:hypothetical protein